jgi:ABC-type multidrug transport system ATPase subunit
MLSLTKVSISPGAKKLLCNIDLELTPGSGVLVSGPNGIGKSSLLAAIAGDLAPSAGEIRLAGKLIQDFEPIELSQRVAVMYQKPIFSVSFLVSEVLDLLNLFADSTLFKSLNLTEKLTTRLSHLSGGELQRLFFYMTVMQSASLYIFDEPISNQDEVGTAIIEAAIESLIRSGKTVVLTSHTGFQDIPRFDLASYKIGN